MEHIMIKLKLNTISFYIYNHWVNDMLSVLELVETFRAWLKQRWQSGHAMTKIRKKSTKIWSNKVEQNKKFTIFSYLNRHQQQNKTEFWFSVLIRSSIYHKVFANPEWPIWTITFCLSSLSSLFFNVVLNTYVEQENHRNDSFESQSICYPNYW